MAGERPPLLDFPCAYTIKVLGRETPDFAAWVVAVVARHGEVDGEADVRPSRRGSFVSVNVTFTAHSMDQLRALHAELNASGRVSMLL